MDGTTISLKPSSQRIDVMDYTVDGDVIKFIFAVPCNSVITEMTAYNMSNTKRDIRIKLKVEGRSFRYENHATGKSLKMDIHVWEGGLAECKISGGVVDRLAIFYV